LVGCTLKIKEIERKRLEMEKFTLVANSTQLQAFGECPEQWNLAHRENLEKKDQRKDAMNAGSFGHTMLETYYKSIASGKSLNDALNLATSLTPEPRLELEPEMVKVLKDKLFIYGMTYAKSDFIPESPETVELGFSVPVYEDSSRLFILEGRLDAYQHTPMGGFFNGSRAIMDHKFQMRHHELYQKRLQFRNYAWATKSSLFIVNYISMTKKTDDTTFRRKVIPFSSLEHQLWERRLIQMFMNMEMAIKISSGALTGKPQPYEHRWNSCENKYGYPCQFTDICEQTNEAAIEMVKKTQYHQIKEWRSW